MLIEVYSYEQQNRGYLRSARKSKKTAQDAMSDIDTNTYGKMQDEQIDIDIQSCIVRIRENNQLLTAINLLVYIIKHTWQFVIDMQKCIHEAKTCIRPPSLANFIPEAHRVT